MYGWGLLKTFSIDCLNVSALHFLLKLAFPLVNKPCATSTTNQRPWSTNTASICVIFGPFYFYCSLVFYILGAFLIKQLFHSRLLDMRWFIANSALRASLAIYHLISHISHLSERTPELLTYCNSKYWSPYELFKFLPARARNCVQMLHFKLFAWVRMNSAFDLVWLIARTFVAGGTRQDLKVPYAAWELHSLLCFPVDL